MFGGIEASSLLGSIRPLLSPGKSNEAAAPAEEAKSADALRDEFQFSPSSRQLMALLQNEEAKDAQQGESLDFNATDLKQKGKMLSEILNLRLKQFEGNLLTMMEEEGISSKGDFFLQKNSLDETVVSGDNPDREKLEQLIENHPEMKQQLEEIFSLGKLMRVMEKSTGGMSSLQGIAGEYAKSNSEGDLSEVMLQISGADVSLR
jgi:hypothetical protein